MINHITNYLCALTLLFAASLYASTTNEVISKSVTENSYEFNGQRIEVFTNKTASTDKPSLGELSFEATSTSDTLIQIISEALNSDNTWVTLGKEQVSQSTPTRRFFHAISNINLYTAYRVRSAEAQDAEAVRVKNIKIIPIKNSVGSTKVIIETQPLALSASPDTLLSKTEILLPQASTLPGSDIYVDTTATGNLTGANWTDAFQTIEDALAVAINGNVIHVAEGSYTAPNVNGFIVNYSIELLGGYPNGGGVRDPRTHLTAITGELSVDTYAQTIFNISATSSIDGFLIHKTSGPKNDSIAAIILGLGAEGSIIRNCVLENHAHESGSVIAPLTDEVGIANPIVFENCLFLKNGDSSDIDIAKNNTFGAIVSSGSGGLLFNNCTFDNNTAKSGDFFHGRGNLNKLTIILNNCTWNNSGNNELIRRNPNKGQKTIIILNSLFNCDGPLTARSMDIDSVCFNSYFSSPSPITAEGFSIHESHTIADLQLEPLANNNGFIDTILPSTGSPVINKGLKVLQDE